MRLPRNLHTCFDSDTAEKLAFMLDSLVRVSQQQRWKSRKKTALMFVSVWEPGTGGQEVETCRHNRAQNTRDNRHVRQQKETLRCDVSGNFGRASTRSRAAYQAQCDGLLQVGHPEAGGKISPGSGGAATTAMGASSSSSDSQALLSRL